MIKRNFVKAAVYIHNTQFIWKRIHIPQSFCGLDTAGERLYSLHFRRLASFLDADAALQKKWPETFYHSKLTCISDLPLFWL